MLTSTEQLIEAISYAEDDDVNWWEIFDSPKQAKLILSSAMRENADEYQMMSMLAAKDVDMFDSFTVEEAYTHILKSLQKEIDNHI